MLFGYSPTIYGHHIILQSTIRLYITIDNAIWVLVCVTSAVLSMYLSIPSGTEAEISRDFIFIISILVWNWMPFIFIPI